MSKEPNIRQVELQLTYQQWRSDDGTIVLNGTDLASRLWARRLYATEYNTKTILFETPIGSVLKTGVSAWERIA